jgi:hypothetical protein
MNGQVDDLLHQPFGIFSLLVAMGSSHIGQLCGASVGIDTSLKEHLNEENLVWNSNREQPIKTVKA